MDLSGLREAIVAVRRALQEGLGGDLVGMLLYGSLVTGRYHPRTSDINLLAVIADDARLDVARDAFQSVGLRYGAHLRRAPIIVRHGRLANYLRLRPALGRHLATTARSLLGPADWLPTWAADLAGHPRGRLAAAAGEAMAVSALLAKSRLEPQRAADLETRLGRLFWRVTRSEPPGGGSAVLLAQIQATLAPPVARAPEAKWNAGDGPADGPPYLPSLIARYEHNGEPVLVLPDPLDDYIEESDWTAVADALNAPFTITTPGQLRLVLAVDKPVESRLHYYNYVWGDAMLSDLSVPDERVYQTIAGHILDEGTAELIDAYFTEPDSAVHDIIHDYQNKLLNIQLQHELLCRLQGQPSHRPPPLPDRSAPAPERIAAIYDQYNWWAGLYLSQLDG